jgi:hypothetical protein
LGSISLAINVHGSTFEGWQIEEGGGQYSITDGIMRLSGSGAKYIYLYEHISPEGDFNFSVQVAATKLEGFGVYLRSSLPIQGSTAGVNFYLKGFELFRLVFFDKWTGSSIGVGAQLNVWYTMALNVYSYPFRIVISALAQNGTLLGSFTASDMTNFGFHDIKYLGFGTQGGGDYMVTNTTAYGISIPLLFGTINSAASPVQATPSPSPSPILPSINPTSSTLSTPTFNSVIPTQRQQ